MEPEIQLPQMLDVLDQADVCVAGGGVAGLAAALTAAANGLETVLLEERSALGWEIPHGLDLYLAAQQTLPSLLKRIVDELRRRNAAREGILDPVASECLFDELVQQAKVRVHFRTMPGSWEKASQLVRVTTKSGPMVIQARVVIDATENARLALRAGATFSAAEQPQRRTRAFLICAVEPTTGPEEISVQGAQRVIIRPTLWPNEACVCFEYTAGPASRAESDARRLMACIMETLHREKKGFEKANLSLSGHESFALQVPKLDPTSLPDGMLVAGPTCLGRKPTLEERAGMGERAAANACSFIRGAGVAGLR